MAPILYKLDSSPPACSVRMVADIIGLQLDCKEVDFRTMEHKSVEYVKLNPLGTIPVLVDDDFALADSHAIMTYLVSKYGGDELQSLYPRDVRTRSSVHEVMFFDTGILFIRMKVVALPTIMEGMKGPSAKHLADIEEAYGMIEGFLSRHKYVAADQLTIADLCVSTSLAASQVILKLNADKFPLTAAWFAKMEQESFYKNITAPGIATFEKAMQFYWEKNSKQ